VAIIGAVFVGLIVIIAIAAGSSRKKASDTAAKTCQGLSYPDQQNLDVCADANGEVRNFGLTVAAKNFRRESNRGLSPEICADVTYFNRSQATKDFNTFDWKLQTPSGVVQSFELTNATLSAGQLVSGGNKAGSVCFDDHGEKGQFVLIWKPSGLRSDRGVWLITL
jgi:hypothetical protein